MYSEANSLIITSINVMIVLEIVLSDQNLHFGLPHPLLNVFKLYEYLLSEEK